MDDIENMKKIAGKPPEEVTSSEAKACMKRWLYRGVGIGTEVSGQSKFHRKYFKPVF